MRAPKNETYSHYGHKRSKFRQIGRYSRAYYVWWVVSTEALSLSFQWASCVLYTQMDKFLSPLCLNIGLDIYTDTIDRTVSQRLSFARFWFMSPCEYLTYSCDTKGARRNDLEIFFHISVLFYSYNQSIWNRQVHRRKINLKLIGIIYWPLLAQQGKIEPVLQI